MRPWKVTELLDMPHHGQYGICTEVSPECPVVDTTYGYRPNLAGNSILLAVFAICTVAQLVLGLRYRLRAFTFAVSLGCLGEAIGYGGRIMMNSNPWSKTGFKIQICCLILSPSFLAAGIYLTIKHLVIYFGPEMSRIRPKMYTRIFISCELSTSDEFDGMSFDRFFMVSTGDIVSIISQAAGGGVASAETANLVNIGDDIMIAGIAFQVATMFVCICLAVDFGIQVFRHHIHRSAGEGEVKEARELPQSFRYYAACCAIAFALIFVRCVYRYVRFPSIRLLHFR